MRLRSVDVFRGVTVAAMVIVNNPGDWSHVYPPLLHAEWHGGRRRSRLPLLPLHRRCRDDAVADEQGGFGGVLRRGAIIFALGLLLAGFPFFNVATWRIPGVLQRIACSAWRRWR